MQADDKDFLQNGQIVYDIIDGDFLSSHFTVDNKTNMIVLKEDRTLDFEQIVKMKKEMKTSIRQSLIVPAAIPYDEFLLAYDEVDINLIIRAMDLGLPQLQSVMVAKVIVKVKIYQKNCV